MKGKDDDSIQEGYDLESVHLVTFKGKNGLSAISSDSHALAKAEIVMKRRAARGLDYYVHYLGGTFTVMTG